MKKVSQTNKKPILRVTPKKKPVLQVKPKVKVKRKVRVDHLA